MGERIRPHEIYLGSFFDRFNQRFGPADIYNLTTAYHAGGIAEIAALQKQFTIFKPGRPFLESAALLGLGGTVSGPAKDRWIGYLAKLPKMQSDDPAQNGDERIVNALVANFRKRSPLPCFMQAYDGRTRQPGLVVVDEAMPLFYLAPTKFLVISLPMRPDPASAATAEPKSRRPRQPKS